MLITNLDLFVTPIKIVTLLTENILFKLNKYLCLKNVCLKYVFTSLSVVFNYILTFRFNPGRHPSDRKSGNPFQLWLEWSTPYTKSSTNSQARLTPTDPQMANYLDQLVSCLKE